MKIIREKKLIKKHYTHQNTIYKKDKLLYTITKKILDIKYLFSKENPSPKEIHLFDETIHWFENFFVNKTRKEQNTIFEKIKLHISKLDGRYIILVDFLNEFLENKK